MKPYALLLLAGCATPTAATTRVQAFDQLDMCLHANVAQNLDSRNSCVQDALDYCNSQVFGPDLCNQEELSRHAQFGGFRTVVPSRPDAGTKESP